MLRLFLVLIFTSLLCAGVNADSNGVLFVAAYEKVPDINLKAEIIPGDHSFSVSRVRMQRMVIDWMNGNCR